MMNERFKAGLIARTDVTESLAQYQNAVANRIAGDIARTSAQEALAAILGQPVDTLSPLRDDIRYQAPYPADMNQWVALARQRNPQVEAARHAYTAALRNRDVQDAGRLPKLDFVGNATWSKQGLASQRSSDGKDLSAGVELSVPLYTGGQVGLSVRQASYQADAARNQIDAAERQVVAQARSSFLNLQADRSRLEARQDAVKSGETVAEASQVGYELGVRNIVDVLLAQRNAFAARRDYVNSRYDYVINVIRLRAAAGQLTANDLTEINQWLVPNAANPVSSAAVATGTALDQPTP
jgi:outer membrane protein